MGQNVGDEEFDPEQTVDLNDDDGKKEEPVIQEELWNLGCER